MSFAQSKYGCTRKVETAYLSIMQRLRKCCMEILSHKEL